MIVIPEWLKHDSIAHRGFKDIDRNIPENTLEACLLAKRKGYPIEIDIKITNENEIILFHDKYTNKKTNINKRATSLTRDDLKKLRYKDTDFKVPYFKDILEAINGEIPILIELKFCGSIKKIKRLTKETSNILKNYKGEYVIQSFYPNIKKLYNTYNSEIPVGVLNPLFIKKGKLYEILNTITYFIYSKNKYDFLPIGYNFLSEKKLNKIREKCKKLILLWYIDSKEEEEKYKDDYTNIIFTYPKIDGEEEIE